MTDNDCETHVKNVILKTIKNDVKVMHIFVNCSSQERYVYVKFASSSDAEKAYKRIHSCCCGGM